MVPPSFQKTLFQLENKLRQMQTLERTVLQAAALDDEGVVYHTASQLADAASRQYSLPEPYRPAPAGPMCSSTWGNRQKAPRRWR